MSCLFYYNLAPCILPLCGSISTWMTEGAHGGITILPNLYSKWRNNIFSKRQEWAELKSFVNMNNVKTTQYVQSVVLVSWFLLWKCLYSFFKFRAVFKESHSRSMYRTLYRTGELTLHEIQHEDTWGDGLGGHLDPPLEKEREQKHSDQTLTSQCGPGTFWFGFAECRSLGEKWRCFLHSFTKTSRSLCMCVYIYIFIKAVNQWRFSI